MVDGLAYLDLDLYGRELDDPLAELEQDLVHRLIEEPGSNLADLDRGVGIIGLLSSMVIDVKTIAHLIEIDFKKDDRVQTVAAELSAIGGGVYRIDIQVVCDEGNLGIALEATGDGTVRRVT